MAQLVGIRPTDADGVLDVPLPEGFPTFTGAAWPPHNCLVPPWATSDILLGGGRPGTTISLAGPGIFAARAAFICRMNYSKGHRVAPLAQPRFKARITARYLGQAWGSPGPPEIGRC